MVVSLEQVSANAQSIVANDIQQLITIPVQKSSVAIMVSNLVNITGATATFPRVLQDGAASWLKEGAEYQPSDLQLDDIVVSPAKMGGLTVITREAASDTNPSAQALIGEGLVRQIVNQIDKAYFGTKGTSTVQPGGLEDEQNVTAVAAPAAWVNLDPFNEALINIEKFDLECSAFVAHPDDVLAMSVLKESASSQRGLLTPSPTSAVARTISGIPLRVSSAVAKGTVWGIPAGRTFVVVRENVSLEVDNSTYFTSDRTAIKASMRVGFAFPHPQAIQKIMLTA